MRYTEILEPRLQLNGGTLDASFGSRGTATVSLTAPLGPGWTSNSLINFTQDANGRLYVFGSAVQDTTSVRKDVLIRLTRDGQVDTSYNGSGYRTLDRDPRVANPTYEPLAFVDQNNRAYVVDGALLWRMTPAGKVDLSFGKKGKIELPIASVTQVVFDAEGRVYVGGSSSAKGGTRMTAIRLTESGAVDMTWGYKGGYSSPVPGIAIAQSSSRTSGIRLMRVLSDGKMLIAGAYQYRAFDTSINQIAWTHGTWVTRLNTDGTVDTTYGNSGYADEFLHDSDVQWFTTSPITLEPDGSVIGEIQENNDASDPDVSQYGSNYLIPADGSARHDITISPPAVDTPANLEGVHTPVAVDSSGRITAAASGSIFRSDGNGNFDASFGTDGVADAGTVVVNGVQLAPDGSILYVSGTDSISRLWRDDAPLAQVDARLLIARRNTAYRFAVTWRDDDGVDPTSLGNADLHIVGPFDGRVSASRSVTLESVEPLGNGRYLAWYHVTSNGGWSRQDNGIYSINLVANQVKDVNGVAAAPQSIGAFRVRIA